MAPFLLLLVLSAVPRGSLAAQTTGDVAALAAGSPLMVGAMNDRLKSITTSFAQQMGREFHYCIKNMDDEWNTAFNFSSDPTFLTNCMKDTDGDLPQRVCTAAEMKFYFESFLEGNGRKNYVRPNKNCNLTSWIDGCEPGWACSAGKEAQVNLTDAVNFPSRTLDCRGCCAGFFCPHGLTCMIPCPLGAYCPGSTLNKTTGVCDPYHYQPPPGKSNHTCGGADRWADVVSTDDVFCPAGYYCPSTIKKLSCSSGFYCRKGSTSQTKCFNKGSCKPNSANQDITIFGALLVGALCLVLLIIYNFSGQLLMNREKKQAKSREAAARHARETAMARERWKSAKDVAKKHAAGLQSSLSRTFSRKKTTLRSHEPPKGIESDAVPSKEPVERNNNNLTDMMRSLEENPEKGEVFNVEIGEKKKTKGRHAHTQSQIFKYAYGQIEKEKAMEQQNQNLTFSGVISMATEDDIKKRPAIEIAFKDLTLTLKGSKKKLLRSVTGKLMPGRVAAVMGPSGAGKTTFLSAIAGKATGCVTTGMILINGKMEPIRAYKRIIGFVPQDDIVHGNLTVQENLWFNARCRLSADMSKADKVLVVERVIGSLGLQAVRDSLVGTVEQRGISGGQRKRVNVGLEMVMEPSVLILDEPTSGLDSASSLLLLRALRREALEGVNISMVVHQPSYTLYNMFDDLILLAKGGMTVYHGPVKKVEEYFAGLGIVVPDRVNPPDYYIDILEGIVKPNSSAPVNVKDLPLRWMLHNGYEVPRDMLQSASDAESSFRGAGASGEDSAGQSIAGEVWGNVRDIVGQKKDEYDYNKSSENLSNRSTPGILRQYKYYLGRCGKQRLREARIQGVDYLILGLAGICLGTLAKVSDETFGALGYTYTVIAVSLLCKIGALRSFSLEKIHYWRERASGMSSLAYFLSKDTIDHFNTIIKPMVYLSMFYFFNNPRSSIWENYVVLVALVYCVTGIGYTFAIFFQPGSAQLWSALLPVVLTLIATNQKDTFFANLCYTKWALEAFVIANAQRYSGVWLITRCGSLVKNGYDINDKILCIVVLAANGVIFRQGKMEAAAGGDSFVLRSGVRAGLKREFAFAIASQAALEPLGRTRRSSRTLLNTSPEPKRPRPPPPPPHPLNLEEQEVDREQEQAAGPVLALMAAAPPSPQPPPPTAMDADADPAPHTSPMETLESSARRITRSMLHKPPPPPAAADNAKEAEPQPESEGRRRFTRSLLLKDNKADHSNNDDDLSGTTTASNSSSPSTTSINKGTSILHKTKIPTNLRELLATGLLEGQPVKYIMRKGKRAVLRGVIKRIGILCSCSSCKGRKVVSPYYFEVHAGSTKKHPSDYIFLENGNNLHDILRVCANATPDMLESAIQKAIGPAPHKRVFKCQSCKSSFSTQRRGKFALLCDSCLESKGCRSGASPSKIGRSPTSSADRRKSASPGSKTLSAGRLTRKDKGLHKVVFMSGVLPEGTDVGYYVGGKRLLDGYIKDLGIFCHCCNTVVSPSQFESHAGRAARRKPYHNIYMSNGVSLHELSISLSKGEKMSNRQSDDLCSICSDGGQLLLCDTCPRAFHRECVGLSAMPKGTWCCRYCENRQQRESCLAYNNNAIAAGRIEGVDPLEQIFTRSIRIATTPETGFGGCALCKHHDFSRKKFSTRTVLLCDQCGREYHVGCLKEHDMADLTALPEGAWYCSTECMRINQTLEDLLSHGAEPVTVVDMDLIKKKREERGLSEDGDLDVRWRVLKDKSSIDSKLVLSKAVAIFHESFDPIVQITTGRDLIPAMVYGRSVRDQDYTGMYCAVLTVGNNVVSAGLFRIMGSEIAELPLVATSRDSQGLGYFQALFACIERLLASLKVKHFVLPAAEEAESIWTQRFGFTKISQDELREYLKGGRTTVFQGTSTLHKLVPGQEC